MSRRVTIHPSPVTGWNPAKHKVEVEPGKHANTFVVYRNRRPIGHVVYVGDSGHRFWDYTTNTDKPHRQPYDPFIYPSTSRLIAVERLVDAVERGATR